MLVASRSEVTLPSGSRFHADLIYPLIYPIAPDSLPWNPTGEDCGQAGSGFINDMIQRHIYSKDPMQPTYTAGLFWLFQNAALHDIVSQTNSTNQKNYKTRLHRKPLVDFAARHDATYFGCCDNHWMWNNCY